MSATRSETELVSITTHLSTASTHTSTSRTLYHNPTNDDGNVNISDTTTAINPPNSNDVNHDRGWIVILACSIHSFWLAGWAGAWGVIQTALLQSQLATVPTSTITFVGSLTLALEVLCGVLAVRLSRAIGARYTSLLGSVFLGLGIVLSSVTASDIGGMFVTSGVLTGVGCSLLYAMTNALPVQWFRGRVGMANGIIKFAGGLGATVISVVSQALIDHVGIVWAFRVLGFVMLATGVPAALLIRERGTPGSSVGAGGGPVPFINFSLFRNLPFVGLFLAGAIGTFSLFIPPVFLPLFAHSVGLSASTGAGIVAAFNACTAVGRFAAGFACDKYGPINMLLLAMCINAVSMLAIWPVSATLAPLLIFAAINGVANGAFFVTMPLSVVASMVGPGHASVAMSMSITGWFAGYLMGSPIAGILISATGAETSTSVGPYRAAIFYAGGVAVASGAFVLVTRLKLDTKLRKKL